MENLIVWIGPLVSLIALIVFFVMASRIGDIKTAISPTMEDLESKYKMHKFFGDNEKALEALKLNYWMARKKALMGTVEDDRVYVEKDLKERYEMEFQSLGSKYPDIVKS